MSKLLEEALSSITIIIDYYYHLDGPEGKIQSRSFTLSTALQSFGYWLDNEATADQYYAFLDLFQIPQSSEIKFDVDKALNYLKSNLVPVEKSGHCINHMVPALIDGGIIGLKDKPIKAASLYGPILMNLGFVDVTGKRSSGAYV